MDERSCLDQDDDAEVSLPWYGDGAAYWDKRYVHSAGSNFDWLEPYERIRDILVDCLSRQGVQDPEILHVGCGNSRLPRQMHDDGLRRIVNIDISEVVISQMAARHADLGGVRWLAMDATDMTGLEDEAFDLVIDKGMLDTIVATKDSLMPDRREAALLLVARYLKEVCRVLRPGGVLLCVSHSPSHARKPFLALPCISFEVRVEELPPAAGCGGDDVSDLEALDGGDDPNFVYICTRTPDARASLACWPEVEEQLSSAGLGLRSAS